VPDRAEAIADAARGALPGDVLSILGRGNIVEAIHDRRVGDRDSLSQVFESGRVSA
jgi:hypothetical protein